MRYRRYIRSFPSAPDPKTKLGITIHVLILLVFLWIMTCKPEWIIAFVEKISSNKVKISNNKVYNKKKHEKFALYIMVTIIIISWLLSMFS